jgi:hypothetical protein
MANSGTLRPGPVPTPSSRDAAEQGQQLAASQLADVRKSAESWRNGLLAVLGLTTTVLVVKGRDSFKDLDPLAQALIGLSLLVGLVLAAAGSWQAMRAAYGDPRPRRTEGILSWDYQDSEAAITSLKWARRCLFGALFFIALAVALTWYWPTESSPKVRADFGLDTACGDLRRADSQAIVVNEDGSDKTYSTALLTSLKFVTTCP